jgi:hypothetical protein
MKLLRQNTATSRPVGPAVDKDNGYSPVTSLVATGGGAVDELSIYKHEATAAVDLRAVTTFTHRAGGMYTVTFDAGDVNTPGALDLVIRDDSEIRPLRESFFVVPANVFDALTGADLLQVDMREIAGVVGAATKLSAGAQVLATGTVDGVATTTSIPTTLSNTVDNDHFVPRWVGFLDGPLAGQSNEITGYDAGSRTLTVKAFTSAPANGNAFVVY